MNGCILRWFSCTSPKISLYIRREDNVALFRGSLGFREYRCFFFENWYLSEYVLNCRAACGSVLEPDS